MRKMFDLAELLLCVVFSLFYYITFDICDDFQLGETIETVIALIVGTIGNMALDRFVRKYSIKYKKVSIAVVLGLLLAEELFLQLYLGKSFFLLAIEDLMIWGFLPMLCLYFGQMLWVKYKKKKIKEKHGDGSEGLKLEATDIAEQIDKLKGENQPLEGNYDKTCAVKCTNGTFVGKKEKSILGFKGIPYAVQPVGEKRWQKPEPEPASDKVYEAYYYGHQEPQPKSIMVPSSFYLQGEDCLHLNIWLNTKYKEKQPRSVVVFFPFVDNVFGGTANPNFDGDSFVKEHPEIIFVNVDYRFGYFADIELSGVEGSEAYPDAANLGLLDQIAALTWLKENLPAFGGNPESITILGSTNALLLPVIPEAKGLFKRAICLDGSAIYTSSKETAQEDTKSLMDYFNVKCMDELLQLSGEQLSKYALENYNSLGALPVRDGKLLPDNILEAYAKGEGTEVDLLLGTSLNLGRVFIAVEGENAAEQDVTTYINYFANMKPEYEQCLTSFKEKYCSQLGKKVLVYLKQYSYLFFHMPNNLLCKKQAEAGGKVHYFLWSVASPVENFGAYHGAILAYLLGKLKNYEQYGLTGDPLIGKVWQQMVVNFVKAGNPSLEDNQVKNVEAISWPAFDASNKSLMLMEEKSFALDKSDFIEQAESLEPLADELTSL